MIEPRHVCEDYTIRRPRYDRYLAAVLYDITTIRAEGLSEREEDVRRFGMVKEGVVARQFLLGVVQSADGIPLCHEVFDGDAAEVGTLKPVIDKVFAVPHPARDRRGRSRPVVYR